MRQVDHFSPGGAGGATGRKHQIWNPSVGDVQTEWAATIPQQRAWVTARFRKLIGARIQARPEI